MRALKPLTDVRQIHIIDALRYSLLMEARSYAEMWSALRRIEKCKATHPPESTALRALAATWEVIDMTHRVIGLSRQVRGLSQRSVEFKRFLADTKAITKFRNQLQHLNSHIPKIAGKTNPVLGTVSWVTKSGKSSYTISFGGGNQDTQYHTIPFDTVDWLFVSKFQFTAGNSDIDLTACHLACTAFSEHFANWIVANRMQQRGKQKIGIVRVHLNQQPPK